MEDSPLIIERAENERGEIQLQKRGEEYEIISNGTFIMATYNGESEKLLVEKALACAPNPKHVLIGGLGVGYSLAAALAHTNIKTVTVVEIEQKIIEWNQTHLARYSLQSLEDPRTILVHDDFIHWMERPNQSYDVVCLDIDNGPDWTMIDSNQSLYQLERLQMLASLLNPNGVLAFWSATASLHFMDTLREIFTEVKAVTIPQRCGEPDYIFIAR